MMSVLKANRTNSEPVFLATWPRSQLACFFAVLPAIGLSGCGTPTPPPPSKPQVKVAVPIARDVVDWDDYVGRFEAIQDVTVTPRVSGTIVKILFRDGQDVREGQPLFVIDPRPYRATTDQALANVGKARATLVNARTELARARKLLDLQAVSREEYETKVSAVRADEAEVKAQRAAAESAQLNSGFTTVRAPVSGRVSDRRASIGNVVAAGTTPLTRIVSLDPIRFTFEGSESFYLKYARKAASGERGSSRTTPNPVEVQLADESGYPHHGRMVFVDNAIDPRSGTIKAHAELSNVDHFLTPGMFGRARLLGSGSYHAMLVPDEAIVTDQTRRLVYVVSAQGKVEPHPVEIGPIVSGLRVVRSGLRPTEHVVLDGLARLQPGADVTTKLITIKPHTDDTSPVSTPLYAPAASEATTR